MNKSKALLVILVGAALAILFIVAIWPALNGDSDGYSGAIPVVSKVVVKEEGPVEPAVGVMVVASSSPSIEGSAIETISNVTEEVPEAPDNNKENETEGALYSVVDGDKLDANSYAGFKLYRNWCARCHGTYGQGMVGPNLADSLKVINEKQFFDTVENGKTGQIGSGPTWKKNVKVMAGRDQLYAYLMARSDGAIGEVKPKKQ